MVDFNVNGKTAVVTGGTRGLGLYTAEAYVLGGAKTVVITSRNVKACQEAKAYLEKVAGENGKMTEIISIPADLAKEKECEQFFKSVMEKVATINILVANAGASWGAPLESHPVSAVKKILDLNVVAVFHTIQLFAPILEEAGTAEDPLRILIMSSVASLVASDPVGVYGYLASKSGVSHMGKNLALQLGPRNITVNSLAPGFFPTKMSQGVLDMAGDIMAELNPRKRLGVKEDIMSAVLFLSARQSNYINGIVLPIDGGSHVGGGFTPKL
ncbi:NAD(P)-binding protein [Metschnikowia bicuspidata var. bicuspidata NRRL YB-4993]|uniref:NAD(P)-binding protein n=1 Tax=Metschnikowia bicuspidata var. bicuspidata NRRL YB-4993 TaxID=869754 RepID=A0A1A0H6Q8_9ASCO|nr:NAD(P)-binding protein [Metschnikowia bicuspidata var. bicuspidata NRRL YB-4993]OBA19711.1 NAD(P)-binding protein [Metschnikowia bicuspidata var. bicuspidata NRRL YB-4993]